VAGTIPVLVTVVVAIMSGADFVFVAWLRGIVLRERVTPD
jgi:hypothetical protein